MAKKNDTAILKLKSEIELKKQALKATERFSPITNCSLTVDGERFNLHAVSKEQLLQLLVKVKSLLMAAEALGLAEQAQFSGFKLGDWMSDLQVKWTILDKKQEEARLKKLEERLHTLLSADKKVELELDELRNLI